MILRAHRWWPDFAPAAGNMKKATLYSMNGVNTIHEAAASGRSVSPPQE
jgi:hypothetical protein